MDVWKSASENGKVAECSASTQFQVDMGLEETKRRDTIIICGGINVKDHTTKPILNWLGERRDEVYILVLYALQVLS